MEYISKQKTNQLDLRRRMMKFSQGEVAYLLGHKDSSACSAYERGTRLPSLVNALRLSIILRTPVEFLFYDLFDGLKHEIRAEEERMAEERAKPMQQVLF